MGEAYDFIPTSMDPPEQRKFRTLASMTVGMPVVDAMEPRIQALAIDLIERLRPLGQCSFTEGFAEP